MDNEWVTVAEAAEILGTSKQAIRQRIYRDTIEHRKDPEGTVYVHITAHNEETNAESYGETIGDIALMQAHLDSMKEQIQFLRAELERKDHLLAAALERIPPQLEAPQEPSESPVSASEERGKGDVPPEQERRSWWQRLFS